MAGKPAIKTITVDDKIMSNSETMNANELVTTQEITNSYIATQDNPTGGKGIL